MERRGLVVLDVHAHLSVAGARQRQPERAHAGEASARLAYLPRDRARNLDVSGRQIHVECDQRPACADDHDVFLAIPLDYVLLIAFRGAVQEIRQALL